ncbi:YdbH domain-containing protein [Sphingomonas sp. PAMC 26617]|uniref:YdbH domain-containing protein n=1 Tax=Sphingomonas sp. PAMC 26617 TaxID=1112216 RepID=UPI00028A1C5B|nr:YdbH domain-containing protein [Sphingomonas sp. PAMC 26617]
MTDDISEESVSPGPTERGRALWRWIVPGIVLAVIVVLAAVWLARKPVAEHFIDDALRAAHVPARYEISRIGLRTQRLTNVRIGDPARPDLVADWVEVDTSLWFSGVGVTAIRAGHVAMRATLAKGTVSFGAIDRLLPAPSGKPFALPAIHAEIGDARIALGTPYGPVALVVAGKGRLDDGFRGTLAAKSALLQIGACRIASLDADVAVRIDAARPSLAGPVAIDRGACGGTSVTRARADLSVALGLTLDHFKGKALLAVGEVAGAGVVARQVAGPVTFVGSASDVSGTLELNSGPMTMTNAASGQRAAAGGTGVSGRYRYADDGFAFDGQVRAERGVVPPALLARLAPLRTAGAGTPIAPLAARLSTALQAAARSIGGGAAVSAIVDGARGQVVVSRLDLASASGARASVSGGSGIVWRWPGGLRVEGDAEVHGGGLPSIRATLAQAAPGAAIVGTAVIAPYDASGARLALAPVRLSAGGGGASRITTRVVLSGPFGDGRVDDLAVPLDATWGRGGLVVNPMCAAVGFARLRTNGVDLPRSAVTVCPQDGAMLRLVNGKLGGGGRIGGARLAGALGSSPLTLALQRAAWTLADGRFAAGGVALRLGAPDRVTRLDIADLGGALAGGGAAGRFAGAGGQIGAVPLVLSGATGGWRFAQGVLGLDGTMTVADAAAVSRFRPLAAQGVTLALQAGRITAAGTLVEPSRTVRVADVRIVHDLSAGTGHADLSVPGIVFGPKVQPELLTPLTLGVVADVVGTVSGAGHIRWTPQGLTSDGVFRTANTDLAAAFGPVTGIAGEIRFTDLLGLATAPGQVATVKSINPGIAVTDGTIRYQLLPGTRIAVEEGRWPFAGGTLRLEPTLLDFGSPQERRMTFRVTGMEAAQFLQQFDFKNLDATGVFDGVLPMVFDSTGGRITDGTLVVRPGGGTIAYVGEITQKDVGFWANYAFQALKSLRYRNLSLVMNGPLAGEMITEVKFAGISQGAGAKRNFLFDRLQKLPLVFNIRVRAPFRQLIDSAQSFYDPKRLIERNLPSLLQEQDKQSKPPVIQPPESRIVP